MVFERMNTATRIHFVKSLTNNNKNYEYAIMSLILRLSEILHFTTEGAWIHSPGCEMAGARTSVRLCELQELDRSVNLDARCLKWSFDNFGN